MFYCSLQWLVDVRLIGMRLTILLILLISGDFSDADLCQPENITYSIGKNQTLLDIDSETISNLPTTCYKQFNIAGALKLKLYIDKLSPSGNKYFAYGDLGIGNAVSFDRIFISPSNCPKSKIADNVIWTELVANGYKTMTSRSPVLCLKFIPSITARNLGTHMKGQGIKILLNVELAVCNQPNAPRSQTVGSKHDCVEYCDNSGKVNKCPQTVTRSTAQPVHINARTMRSTPLLAMSAMMSTTNSLTPLGSSLPSTPVPTMPNSATRTQVKQINVEFPKPMTSLPYISTDFITVNFGSLRHTDIPRTTIHSQKAQMTSPVSTLPSSHTRISSNIMVVTPASDTIATSVHNTNEHHTGTSVNKHSTKRFDDIPATTSQSTSRVSSSTGSTLQTGLSDGKASQMKDEEVFGLVDALYIVIGCLLTITIVVVVSCCMFRKYKVQNHMDHDCQTDSSSHAKTISEAYTTPWRDNWLVRHHSTHRRDSLDDEDVFNLSENDLHLVHGNFVHQSNPELHLIHACQTATCMDETIENIYDNNHYLLKLNKGDFDAKVKDVLRKQRLLSITSYDLSKPVQRRRAYTVSESSQDSKQSLDQVSDTGKPETDREKDNKQRRYCQRSSSSVSGNGTRSERVARVAGRRRRTLSQRSHANIKEENSVKSAETNDLNDKSRCSSIEIEMDKGTRHNMEIQISLDNRTSSDSQSSQTNDIEAQSQAETIAKEILAKNIQKEDSTVQKKPPIYPPSCRYGASGTMQFKK